MMLSVEWINGQLKDTAGCAEHVGEGVERPALAGHLPHRVSYPSSRPSSHWHHPILPWHVDWAGKDNRCVNHS